MSPGRSTQRNGRVVLLAATGLCMGAMAIWARFEADMRGARTRIASRRSTVITSPQGEIEFIQGGEGPTVLVIHGSGGGFDQGEILARALLGDGFHWIAPSRFGYLRSTFREGATFDDQADAYVALLDHLGVKRTAVVALSHGGPSALLLAVRHAERVSSLTLLSAGVASSTAADQAAADDKGAALTSIFQHDPLYWAMTTLFRGPLFDLMGADGAVIASLTPEQRRIADQVVDYMHPVSARSAGVLFDHHARMPNDRIAAIRVPTLIVHAKDDRLQLFANAEYAAAHIPGAQLLPFEHGGHLLVAVERERVAEPVQRHIRQHAR